MLLAARIGVAKRVHVLEKYVSSVPWGTSICGKWAGLVSPPAPADKQVTCIECAQILTGSQRKTFEIDYS